ncbi:BRCT domain-containing protein [Heterostelium album PN500]|uniref:DNA ligase n=1 Tax=Heterostelium pallidum (strain ATCC 26659 / Pp 5 / PN500) TaxID=670386 RepID=D3BJT1_HETP5|nr:BRCT domain-containing protein [Heterostelium album PN500]EFA78161.1 BRCT domain-containing protein [Heterostelium album PN500]|eukprot:XP_020430287.1 BRCT domain-containing protein [Heterostelium album PN500]
MSDKTGSFFSFYKLCKELENESSHTGKSKIVALFVDKFDGDLYLLAKLLLVKEDKRVFRIKDKQMVKILAEVWNEDLDEMIADLDKGDVTETAYKFYQRQENIPTKSTLTLGQVDEFLDVLTTISKFDDQVKAISKFLKKCTAFDWRLVNRIIDSDLKINMGAKYFLEALHPEAMDAYRKANNLRAVIDTIKSGGFDKKSAGDGSAMKMGSLGISLKLMTPIKPMLPKALKSADAVISACGPLFYAEIKYDGERIQIHKQGNDYFCFSRNLKPVQSWKVEQVKPYIPKATKADSIILDGEILLMDTKTSKPLPFGTLGIHKKNGFTDATVCVFLFDILYLNGKSLIDLPISKRREILESNVNVVQHRVELSEITEIAGKEDKPKLVALLNRTFKEKLEGLVIKDSTSVYEPGCRHWIKVKKDYLAGMADSADLLAIGGYYGTGTSGGLVTVFLMCCYDEETETYKTVCKVSGGLDDAAIGKLQPIVKNSMIKISKDSTKVPPWLDILKAYTPDFIVKDPKEAMVFEVESAELTGTKHHTSGFSMRFPRIVKIRKDKDWATSTKFAELKDLAKDVKIVPYDSDDEEIKPASRSTTSTTATKKQKTTATTSTTTTTTTTTTSSSKSSLSSNSTKLKGKVIYVQGDITDPFKNDKENCTIIINYTDNSGKWRNAGVPGAISKKWKNVEDDFVKSPIPLGEIRTTKVVQGDNKIYVCNVSCVKAPESKADSHTFEVEEFGETLTQVLSIAKHKDIKSVHSVKPNYPGLKWATLEELYVKKLYDKAVSVFIHTSDVGTTKTGSGSKRKADSEEEDPLAADEVALPLSNIFEGVNAVFANNLPPANIKKWENIISSFGGQVSTSWIPVGASKTTHLICDAACELSTHVDRLGGLVVTSKWIEDCFQNDVIIDENEYLFYDPTNPDYEAPTNDSTSTTKTDDSSKAVTSKPKKFTLPDFFSGCEIYLHPTMLNDIDTLKRYIISYGGQILETLSPQVSHIISNESKKELLRAFTKENSKATITI